MDIAIAIVLLVLSVALTALVVMQSGKDKSLSGSISGAAETFFGKNKARTMDAMLVTWTKIAACIFILTSLALTIVW